MIVEQQFGAANGKKWAVLITIGTGLGSCAILDGRVLRDPHMQFGTQLGHTILQAHGGRLCLSGARGTAEMHCSATTLGSAVIDGLRRGLPSVPSSRFSTDPGSIDFAAVAEGVRTKDRLCVDEMRHWASNLGWLLMTAVHVYSPELIILGGGLGASAMSFVRTALGDVNAAELRVCYAHEHIIIDRSYTTHLFPDFLLDSVELASAELKEFRATGGSAMVDSMPCGGGRNVVKLAEISRQSGVKIVCPMGLHLAKYYPPEHWRERVSIEEMAQLFVVDINEGIDANDYGGPVLARTTHRAGVIKIASGLDRVDDDERCVFEAAAAAHRETGAPVLTHTEQGTAALEQVEMLLKHGVDLRHVVLSHTDRKPDLAYHKEILASGVRVEFDSGFRWGPGNVNHTLELVMALFEQGFGDQIMLGMDAARRGYWKAYGGKPGMTYLLTEFSAQLKEKGLSDEALRKIFVHNSAAAYSFKR